MNNTTHANGCDASTASRNETGPESGGRKSGLIEALDRDVRLLKIHLPYLESDHVLNIAYNILAGGTCLENHRPFRKA